MHDGSPGTEEEENVLFLKTYSVCGEGSPKST